MHECSLLESPCFRSTQNHRAALYNLNLPLQNLNGAVESQMSWSRSSHWIAYLTIGLLLWQQTWGKKYSNKKVWEHCKSLTKAEMSRHLESVRPQFNRHLCASHKEQLLHSHFHCPLVKLLLCTLKCPTVLSIQIIPGRARLCYFLVWRNKRQMESSVKQHFVVSSTSAVEPFEHMQSGLNRFQGMCASVYMTNE